MSSSRPHARTARKHRAAAAGAVVVLTLTATPALADDVAADAAGDGSVPVQLLSITDLHGYFGDHVDSVPGAHTGQPSQAVGGGAYLASHLDRLREEAALPEANSILFSAGDDFSGWPSETAYFWNEPTIEYLNHVGLEFSTIGNHELDRDLAYLRHMTDGTCEGRPDGDLCFTDATRRRFAGADFDYYSANVVDSEQDALVVRPYHVEQVDDGHGGTMPVGFVHATTSTTPDGGLSFWPENQLQVLPEAAAVNRYAAELQAQGVEAIVAVIHEGFTQAGGYNDCRNPSGPVVEMNGEISAAVDAIVTGHWHALGSCMLPDPAGDPRPVVAAANHGRLINEISLELDRATGDVLRDRTVSTNHANTRTVTPDPEVLRMARYWRDRLAERRDEPVAEITGDLSLTSTDPEETTLGNTVADSFRWAAAQDGGADIGIVMPDKLLRDIPYAAGSAEVPPADVFDVDFGRGTPDDVAQGFTATAVGDATLVRDPELGQQVATFDGSEDAFRYEGFAAAWQDERYVRPTTQVTLQCTFRSTGPVPATQRWGIICGNNAGAFSFYRQEQRIVSYLDAAGKAWKETNLPADQWLDVVMTYDGARWTVYVNGEVVASQADSGPISVPATASARGFAIGDSYPVAETPRAFQGDVAAVRVWSTALTADQVRTLHRADQAPEPEGLVTFGEVMFGVVHETGGFGAALTSGEVTGRELDALLESQWQKDADGTVTFRPLSLSGNVRYRYDPDAPVGEKVAFGQVRVDGKPLKPTRSYRVATLSREFVATEAMEGFDALVGARDLHRSGFSGPDALSGYLRAHSPLTPPSLDRVAPRG